MRDATYIPVPISLQELLRNTQCEKRPCPGRGPAPLFAAATCICPSHWVSQAQRDTSMRERETPHERPTRETHTRNLSDDVAIAHSLMEVGSALVGLVRVKQGVADVANAWRVYKIPHDRSSSPTYGPGSVLRTQQVQFCLNLALLYISVRVFACLFLAAYLASSISPRRPAAHCSRGTLSVQPRGSRHRCKLRRRRRQSRRRARGSPQTRCR